MRFALALGIVSLLAACNDSHDAPTDAGGSIDAGAIEVDSAAPTDASRDATTRDAGMREPCEPEDVARVLCPEEPCFGIARYHWDGERCIEMPCGACAGADCEGGATSREDCESAHAECKPQLCRDTGGTWRWWDQICGDYECGEPPPELCETGYPGCDCGPLGLFDADEGCVDDPIACDGPDRVDQVICTESGGSWEGICCPTECGQFCPEPCAVMACRCGAMEVWDPQRGCVRGARCFERNLGETCADGTRCTEGTLCCQDCGGAGCTGDPTCRAAVCDGDENVDECGNRTDTP